MITNIYSMFNVQYMVSIFGSAEKFHWLSHKIPYSRLKSGWFSYLKFSVLYISLWIEWNGWEQGCWSAGVFLFAKKCRHLTSTPVFTFYYNKNNLSFKCFSLSEEFTNLTNHITELVFGIWCESLQFLLCSVQSFQVVF